MSPLYIAPKNSSGFRLLLDRLIMHKKMHKTNCFRTQQLFSCLLVVVIMVIFCLLLEVEASKQQQLLLSAPRSQGSKLNHLQQSNTPILSNNFAISEKERVAKTSNKITRILNEFFEVSSNITTQLQRWLSFL